MIPETILQVILEDIFRDIFLGINRVDLQLVEKFRRTNVFQKAEVQKLTRNTKHKMVKLYE